GDAHDGRPRPHAGAGLASAWRAARRRLHPAHRADHARPRPVAVRRASSRRLARRRGGMSADQGLCRHCRLPVGRRAMLRTLGGEPCAFCCYGCCIAYQVKGGSREEHDAAWMLVRLGVGSFLSMNVMLFSLLVYSGALSGADAEMLVWIHVLLWLFA